MSRKCAALVYSDPQLGPECANGCQSKSARATGLILTFTFLRCILNTGQNSAFFQILILRRGPLAVLLLRVLVNGLVLARATSCSPLYFKKELK